VSCSQTIRSPRKDKIVPSDLRDVPFIALERGTKMGTLLRQAFSEANETFDFAVEIRYDTVL
jgi:hypothetical protein